MKASSTLDLFLFVSALSLLPLEGFSLLTKYLPGLLWNGWSWLLALVLVFIAVRLCIGEKDRLNTSSVRTTLLLSIAVLLHGLMTSSSMPMLAEVLLALYSLLYFSRLTQYQQKLIAITLIGAMAIYAQWSILHFILQHDLHLQLIGESHINNTIPGVAKFLSDFADTKVVRSYGPYPHPNALAGSLLLALILLPHTTRLSSSRAVTFFLTTSFLLSLSILTTFSRAAILGLFIWHIITWSIRQNVNPPSHLLKKSVLLTTILLLAISPLLMSRLSDPEDRATTERASGVSWSMDIIRVHSWTGTGIGKYEISLNKYLNLQHVPHESWQIAPVHSVPLLVVSELGIPIALVSTLLFFIWIRRVGVLKLAPILPIAPLLLLDHFYYTQIFPSIFLLITLYLLATMRSPNPAR